MNSTDLKIVAINGNSLVIVFYSGSTYEYVNTVKEYYNFLVISSKGKYFHEHIKNNYECHRVS
ncbi:MAG: KTSC domain-containing protein [Bacilli bacterium]